MIWNEQQVLFLSEHYPTKGRAWCADALGVSESAVRMKTHRMGLKQDRSSRFFADWQRRAAESKVGKKRPDQAEVMKRLHREGKLPVTPQKRKRMSERAKAWHQINEHPRGALGMKHTDETRRICGQKSREMWSGMTEEQIVARTCKQLKTAAANGTYARPRHKTTWRAGWRQVGDQRKYFRSKWEANYARYLEWLKTTKQIKDWEHEPEVFWFDGVKRGVVSYLPDFRVSELNGRVAFHEVKGWMDDRSKTKIKRMAKYHPDVTLIVVAAKEYRSVEKDVSGFITDWE
jgi:hypothetical protein